MHLEKTVGGFLCLLNLDIWHYFYYWPYVMLTENIGLCSLDNVCIFIGMTRLSLAHCSDKIQNRSEWISTYPPHSKYVTFIFIRYALSTTYCQLVYCFAKTELGKNFIACVQIISNVSVRCVQVKLNLVSFEILTWLTWKRSRFTLCSGDNQVNITVF